MTRARRALLFLVIAHALLATAYSLSVPLGEAPDEADHWAYVSFLARERRLPQGPTLTQSKHPPFYHATAALIAAVAVPDFGSLDTRLFLRANPDVSFSPEEVAQGTHAYNSFIHTTYEDWPWRPGPLAFHLARLWSVVLSTLTVWATYHVVRLSAPGRPAIALLAAGVLAFLPEFAFIGSVVNNDTAAALFGTLALWGGLAIYRHEGRWRAGWWTPLALGLGLWAKVSTLALWPVVGLALLLGWWHSAAHGRDVRALLRPLLFVFVPASAIGAPWFLRNWHLYGDPFGWDLARQTVDVRTGPWTWADTRWLLEGWFLSFWGKFGSAGHIPMARAVYGALAVVCVLAGAGLVYAVFRRVQGVDRAAVGLLVLAVASTALAIWRYSLVALGTNQGRLLFPAVAAIVGLLAVGLLAWVPPRVEGKASAALIALTALLGVYGLVGVIRPAYAAPPSAPASVWQPHALPAALRFGEITLVAADMRGDPTLYWQATTHPTRDWRTVLRITAEDGTLVWEWKRSPGAGRWSTDHWPQGYVMRDAYAVRWPEWAGPGRYRVEVGVYEFMGSAVIPERDGEPAASPEHPLVVVGWVERPSQGP